MPPLTILKIFSVKTSNKIEIANERKLLERTENTANKRKVRFFTKETSKWMNPVLHRKCYFLFFGKQKNRRKFFILLRLKTNTKSI